MNQYIKYNLEVHTDLVMKSIPKYNSFWHTHKISHMCSDRDVIVFVQYLMEMTE